MHQQPKKCPLFQLFKKKYLENKNYRVITIESLRNFLEDFLFDDFKSNFLQKNCLDSGQIIKLMVCLIRKINSFNF
jgi:hypothetical protein